MTTISRPMKSALTAIALTVAGAAAMAQSKSDVPEVKIEASQPVITAGRSKVTGEPIQTVQITRQVSFADLDLSTSAGTKELEKRMNAAAETVCKDIQNLYPEGAFGSGAKGFRVDSCVKSAVDGAMPQMKVAIAAARSRSAQPAQK